MSQARKEQLLNAAKGTETNIELAKYFQEAMRNEGDEVGVTGTQEDISCLERWAALDRALAENESTD